jgi:hypothetical protein
MAKWQVKLVNPSSAVEAAIRQVWTKVMGDMEKWIKKELVPALAYGSAAPNGNLGLMGIADTPFYAYITSPQGLSELGINVVDAVKLLRAYESSMKVSSNNNMVFLRFGDEAELKLATKHPDASNRNLGITSWLEWVLDGKSVTNAGFVPKESLPPSAQKKIRITSAPGGLMLPQGRFGSKGTWKFPDSFVNYDSAWFAFNAAKLEKLMADKAAEFFTKRASK